MRVLHVYSGNLYGGIETFLVALTRFAASAPRLDSAFALCFEGRLAAELRDAGATVHELGAVRTRYPWTVLRARKRLSELIVREGFDAVVCHSAWPQALLAPAIRKTRARSVFWLHDAVGGRVWIERWAAHNRPDFAICNSYFTRTTLSTVFPDTPSSVEYYPVHSAPEELEPDERRRLRAELGAGDDTVVVIQTSRMQPWKGQFRQLRALARLPKSKDWISVQAGGPQRSSERAYFAELKQIAERLGIAERVRFLGQRNDVRRLLAVADIHCQPNASPEPFGIVFIEALAAGLPIVTMDMGGAQEIVTPAVGFLAGDDDALAGALDALVTDGDMRRRLGAAGPERARELCDPPARMLALQTLFETFADQR